MKEYVRQLEMAIDEAEYRGIDFIVSCGETTGFKSLLTYMKNLQKENEELRKGQQSLTKSIKKWKARYYKIRKEKRGQI